MNNQIKMKKANFENTARDLSDCVEAIHNQEISTETSNSELEGLRCLLILAREVLDREQEIESIIENT
jgi:exonuclease VII small subunit